MNSDGVRFDTGLAEKDMERYQGMCIGVLVPERRNVILSKTGLALGCNAAVYTNCCGDSPRAPLKFM